MIKGWSLILANDKSLVANFGGADCTHVRLGLSAAPKLALANRLAIWHRWSQIAFIPTEGTGFRLGNRSTKIEIPSDFPSHTEIAMWHSIVWAKKPRNTRHTKVFLTAYIGTIVPGTHPQ